ncbi:MAG: hypothetical protein EBQ92_00190, partial [Proteobacteria bacterium]|nr:hypothetical protein [Pseudomonadota bacterium]
IAPRAHQIQLYELVSEKFNDGFCIRYDPMIGGGKTFALNIMLGMYATKMIKNGKKCLVLFACNLKPVQDQAANILYNAGIKFAIGFHDQNEELGYVIKNHFSCKNDEELAVIVANTDIAWRILKQFRQTIGVEHIILCFDEPTFGSDVRGSTPLKENMMVMAEAPKRLILSSATLPKVEYMQEIYDNFTNKYPTAKIYNVNSDEIQIGCDVISFDGNLVVPHLGAKNKEELKKIIETIEQSALFGRIYTQNVVREIYDKMIKAKINDVPNIGELFTNVNNMTSNKVKQIAFKMLKLLLEQSDDVIKTVCSSKITSEKAIKKEKVVKEDDDQDGFAWDDPDEDEDDDINEDNISYDLLLTTQSWKFPNTTIIATITPVEFALKYFSNFISDIYNSPLEGYFHLPLNRESGNKEDEGGEGDNSDGDISGDLSFDRSQRNIATYKSSANVIDIYNREMDIFKKMRNRIIKKTKNEEERSKQLQELEQSAPLIKFPLTGIVNSEEHAKKYAKSYAINLDKYSLRSRYDIESLNLNSMDVPDEILTLLFAGVGIYAPTDKKLSPVYTSTVLSLASTGRLSCIVSDASICYGTDYSISNIIITDEFAKVYSVNTLMQLIGRAGRVGQSWRAFAYVSENVARRLIEYTKDMSDSIMEAQNMVDEFNSISISKMLECDKKASELLYKYNNNLKKAKVSDFVIEMADVPTENPTVADNVINNIEATSEVKSWRHSKLEGSNSPLSVRSKQKHDPYDED